jgi:hypothetical protein
MAWMNSSAFHPLESPPGGAAHWALGPFIGCGVTNGLPDVVDDALGRPACVRRRTPFRATIRCGSMRGAALLAEYLSARHNGRCSAKASSASLRRLCGIPGSRAKLAKIAVTMTILREWRGELRRELAGEYIAYMRDTGLADYRATPGNLGAMIAVRDLDDERAEVVTLSWWPSMDAIRGFAGDDVERAVYYPEDDRFLLTKPEKVQHYESHGLFDPPVP